jgi:circadian clock protein KaiC
MTAQAQLPRVETGVRNLDALFGGGIPRGSVVVLGGPPGSGKTILAEQICFHNASPTRRVLYFNTLSESTAKTLLHLSQFDYFDAAKLSGALEFIDLGTILRERGNTDAAALIMEHVKRVAPALVVIDSFKVFDDLADSKLELRKFSYEIAVKLMAWECTSLLLGEFGPRDFEANPVFSIVDGLVMLTQRAVCGESQRFCQIIKMRGTEHQRDQHTFAITNEGIHLFAPRVTIQREPHAEPSERDAPRGRTGISKLDDLLGAGIPRGSTLLVGGAAGTGKTLLLLQFIYLGARQFGEKGIIFSFEETEERLRAAARNLGWDLDGEIARGMVEIVFIPQPSIMIEGHLSMMQERIRSFGAARVAIDSLSVFLHKIEDRIVAREKVYQLCSVIQNLRAIGLCATDIPYGSGQISRFGVEETVVDGIILLSSTEEGLDRQRYLEVYKLRNTAHLKGRHSLVIGPGGIVVYPRYDLGEEEAPPPVAPEVEADRRLSTGVGGLDPLFGGGLLERSVTLVSGSPGVGKSTLAMQFLLEGARSEQPGLYVALEEGPAQLRKSADGLGLPLDAAVAAGLIEIVHLSRHEIKSGQLLTRLSDRIAARKIVRLALDGANHLEEKGLKPDEVRQLLYALMVRFKALGVTSVLTLESSSLFSIDSTSDGGLSPVADNLVFLRYARVGGELGRTVAVVKTRASTHDPGTHSFAIGAGGLRVTSRPRRNTGKKRTRAPVRR